MPEGDTIHRTARTLAKAIGGRVVTTFSSPLPELADAGVEGRTVRRVYARGKNLLIELDDDRTLYSHMKMDGSWHIYRPHERWRAGRHRARVVLETEPWVAVCFDAPVMELLTPFQMRGHPALKDLGPDLIADELDLPAIVARFRRYDDVPIGVAVMMQRIVAGIGNVYKSEVLFLEGIHPERRVGELDDGVLAAIVTTAAELMKKNLTGSVRRTRFTLDGAPEHVYGRSGKPCRTCGEAVRMVRQGTLLRSTYFCPACQPEHGP